MTSCVSKSGCWGGGEWEGMTLKEQFPFLEWYKAILGATFKVSSGAQKTEFKSRGNLCFVYRFQSVC